MAPAFELAAFTVRGGDEPAMRAERPAMIAALRQAFPGLLAAWLTKRDDGSWPDVILWSTRAEAETAAERVNDVPEAKAWFRHIAESHGVQHVEIADQQLCSRTLDYVSEQLSDQRALSAMTDTSAHHS